MQSRHAGQVQVADYQVVRPFLENLQSLRYVPGGVGLAADLDKLCVGDSPEPLVVFHNQYSSHLHLSSRSAIECFECAAANAEDLFPSFSTAPVSGMRPVTHFSTSSQSARRQRYNSV